MNKVLRFFALVLVAFTITFSSCKSSKDALAQSTEQAAYKSLENSLLWKIDGNGLTQPSYLYGTIHIIDSESFFYPEGTLAALDAADQVVFEIDMNEMSDMSNVMGLMNQAFMKDGKTLKDLLTVSDYKIVEDHFNKIGMPLMLLERMKPMFLSVFASGDMDPAGLQNGSMKSYEMEFMEIANSSNKPMAGLETIEFQMSVFDSIPYEAQAEMLVESIKAGDTANDEFDAMIKLYTTQDIKGMVSMIGDEDQQLSEYEDVLLNKRNQAWISGMAKMMSEGKVFFAVGAGHLAGEQGVINLLIKEGYKLTPMSTNKS